MHDFFFFWSLPIALNKKDTDRYRQSDTISDFKSFQMHLTGSIVPQWGFSTTKPKLVVHDFSVVE